MILEKALQSDAETGTTRYTPESAHALLEIISTYSPTSTPKTSVQVTETSNVPIRLQNTAQYAPQIVLNSQKVTVSDDVHCDIILQHTGAGDEAECIDFQIGKNATVNVISTQMKDENAMFVGKHTATIGENSEFNHTVISLSGKVLRLDLEAKFAGKNASIVAKGAYFAKAKEHLEHHINVLHNMPNCKSDVKYNGVAEDKGTHIVWIANALIEPTAFGTNTFVRNKNLVLTKGAIVDSVPNLEILTGDIQGAGHASSTGRFDDEQLFYLESRGISETDAKKMIVESFFEEILTGVADKGIVSSVREYVVKTFEERTK
ncbi:MAG: SufD family Fe-S cluster assembly protein [Bifidobacteriaceae bacterium]|jgi:Fe-S cluster assembly protein SufD|nr:SufD family Fe-S cluster assembly protein [Bifidobacteriaceae bacterium]